MDHLIFYVTRVKHHLLLSKVMTFFMYKDASEKLENYRMKSLIIFSHFCFQRDAEDATALK